MTLELKGTTKDKIRFSCCKDAGVTFIHEGIESGKMINISHKGEVSVNGSTNVTAEIVGLALIQWANTYAKMIDK